MLLVVVGYGFHDDPFTCPLNATEGEIPVDAEELMTFVCNKLELSSEHIDEILVIKNDEVIEQYSFELKAEEVACPDCSMEVCECDDG
jgi:hypothetical protein